MTPAAAVCVAVLAAVSLSVFAAAAERERGLLTADEVVYDRRTEVLNAVGGVRVQFRGIEVRSEHVVHDLRADTILSDTWTVVSTSGSPPATLTARWVLFDRREFFVVARGSATLAYRDAVLSAEEVSYDIRRDLIYVPGRSLFVSSDAAITADRMWYDRGTGVVTAQGNVDGHWGPFALYAPAVEYDTVRREVTVSSGAEVRTASGEMRVETARGRIDDGVFEVDRFQVYVAPYYGRSARAIVSSRSYVLHDAAVTHCTLDRPHYWLAAREVELVPGERMLMRHVVLTVRGIPLVWLPVYWVSLKNRDDCVIIEPGYDEAYGAFARTRYLFPAAGGRMKVLCDIYERQGLGQGLEYSYAGTAASGSLYGYCIREHRAGRTRWNVLAQDTRTLGRGWSARTMLELLSDEGMYQDYFTENWFRVKRDVRSEVFVSRTAPGWSLRFGAVRDESLADVGTGAARTWRTPAVLTLFPRAIGPFSIADSFTAESRYEEGSPSAAVTTVNEFSCELPLSWGAVSWAPRAVVRSEYAAEAVDASVRGLRQRYTGELPFRVRFPGGMCEVLYVESRFSRLNAFQVEPSTAGVIVRALSPRLDVVTGAFTVRAGWSVDLRDGGAPWGQRFAPLTLDLGWAARTFDAGAHCEFHPGSGRITHAQCSAGMSAGWGRLSLGYGYADGAAEPHGCTLVGEVYSLPAVRLRVDATASSDGVAAVVSRWSCDVTRDLHCWEARIRVTSRRVAGASDVRDILEVWGYAGLKFEAPVPGVDASAAERRAFPWRYE